MLKLPKESGEDVNGAEIVVKTLYAHGVRTLFGYPGGSILPIYDRLFSSRIKHIMCCHEQFACHAAEGYARATGKTGVVLATSGPGATNLVTGIANAYMDSIPLVAITGNVPLYQLGHDAFQEIDITGVTMPITKHNFIVKSVDYLAPTICQAFRIAQSGRKGPVVVDIPSDILHEQSKPVYVSPLPLKTFEADINEIDAAVSLINSAKKPFVCIGGGIISANACEYAASFVEKCGAAAAVTAMGKGGLSADNPRFTGVVGMGVNEETAKALAESDLFIALGVRFSEKLMQNVSAYAPGTKILHFDIDRAEIGKNVSIYQGVIGDAAQTLPAVTARINSKKLAFELHKTSAPHPLEAINRVFGDVLVTTEVGLHQIAAANVIKTLSPRSFITSGGLGTMGFGLPAAIGAAIATGRKTVNIAGDGSFCMNMQELSTSVRYKLPIIQLIVNNHALGMIEKWQNEKFAGRIFSAETPKIDYVALAEAMGACGIRTNTDGLETALAQAKRIKTPVVIDWEQI